MIGHHVFIYLGVLQIVLGALDIDIYQVLLCMLDCAEGF